MVDGVNGNKYSYTITKGDNLTKIAKKNNTTIDTILKLNPAIKNPNLIITGKLLVLPDNNKFVQKEDYDSKKMNLSEITINGEKVEGEFKSNFYANQNIDKLAKPGEKLVITMQPGKEINVNDLPAWSMLNKLTQKHLENEDKIIKDNNGKSHIQTKEEFVKNTELYKAFISDEVNGDNFSGENAALLARGEYGNKVQFPAVGQDNNGNKYFTLHGSKEILYFDATGKQVEFKDGVITTSEQKEPKKEPAIKEGKAQKAPEAEEFAIPQKYDEKQVNLGKVFVNGKDVSSNRQNANFYRNDVNQYAEETLNDDAPSRLDVQIKAGNNLNPKYNDNTAESLLLKITKNKGKDIKETALYKAFVSVEANGENFENGILKSDSAGFNTIQLPSLEADENGTKYFVLHTNDTILYFNENGESINI